MPVTFAYFQFAVGFGRKGAGFELARPCTEAHGATHFVDAEQFAKLVDDSMRRLWIALGRVGALEPCDIARVFDGSALHAQANTKKRHFILAGKLNGVDHSLNTALAKAAG